MAPLSSTRTQRDRTRPRFDQISARLTRNPGHKVVALLLSLIIWLYVQLEQEVEGTVRATVDWSLPAGLVATEGLPEAVMLTVQGSRAALRRAARNDVRVSADMTQASAGEVDIELGALPRTGLPQLTSVLSVAPGTMHLVLDEVDTRKVEVTARTVGEPAAGYRLKSIEIAPPVVELEGPRSVIRDLDEVVTLPIDVSGLASRTELLVSLDLPRGVQPVAGESSRAMVSLEALSSQRAFRAVPVVVVPAAEWEPVNPVVRVVMEGPQATLDRIQGPSLLATVRLPPDADRPSYEVPYGLKEGVTFEISTYLPEEVKVVSVEPSSVEVRRR